MPVKTSLTSVQEINTPAPFLTTGASNVGAVITTGNSVMAQISTVVYPPPQLPLVLDGLLSISALVNIVFAPFLTTMMSNVGARMTTGNSVMARPPTRTLHLHQPLRSQQVERLWPFPTLVQASTAPAPSLTTATCLVGAGITKGNSVMAQPPTVTRQSSQTPWAQDERPCM